MPETFESAWIAAFLVVPGYVYIFFLEAARVRKKRDPLLIIIESLAMSLVVWVLAWFVAGTGVLIPSPRTFPRRPAWPRCPQATDGAVAPTPTIADAT